MGGGPTTNRVIESALLTLTDLGLLWRKKDMIEALEPVVLANLEEERETEGLVVKLLGADGVLDEGKVGGGGLCSAIMWTGR